MVAQAGGVPPNSVVITGAAGFIGRALTARLVAAGYDVLGIDVQAPANWPGRQFIQRNLDEITAEDLSGLADRPAIVHLASIVGVAEASRDPRTTFSNIKGLTEAAIRLSEQLGASTFLYMSSSEVYGNASGEVITEATTLNPISAYATGKVASEKLVEAHAADSGIRSIVIRPFNVYGPDQRADFVVPRFVDLVLRGEPVTVVGDGQQKRTFTYVEDLVTGVELALLRAEHRSIFNLSGAECVTINELVEEVYSAAKTSGEVSHVEGEVLHRPAADEVRDRHASSELAKRDIGYVPRVSLRAGIELVVANRYAHPRS